MDEAISVLVSTTERLASDMSRICACKGAVNALSRLVTDKSTSRECFLISVSPVPAIVKSKNYPCSSSSPAALSEM